MLNDEFKRSLVLFPICWGAIGLAFAASRLVGVTHYGDAWTAIGVIGFFGPIAWLLAGTPIVRTNRQAKAYSAARQALEERKFLETIAIAERSRALWPDWERLVLPAAVAQLVLWRVHEARLGLGKLLTESHPVEYEQLIFGFAVAAAELAGDARNAREKADKAALPPSAQVLATIIRASRERDLKRVIELRNAGEKLAAFRPLIDVLVAWAEEGTSPRPIDKVTFLGETGLEQVEKVWPELADFVRRAPDR